MSRKLIVIVEIDWPEYEDVADELILEDAIREVAVGVRVYLATEQDLKAQ